MYRLVEPMNRTTVSISRPRFCFGRRIFLILLTFRSRICPVLAYKDTFPYLGRSPRRLMSERQRPVYETDTENPAIARRTASFFFPRRWCSFRRPMIFASSSGGMRRTFRFFGAVLLLSRPFSLPASFLNDPCHRYRVRRETLNASPLASSPCFFPKIQ